MKYILTLQGKYVGEYDTREDAEKASEKISDKLDKRFWLYGFQIFERPEAFELDHDGPKAKRRHK